MAMLLAVGLVMVFESSYFMSEDTYGDPLHTIGKQLVALILGAFLLHRVSLIDPRTIAAWSRPALLVGALLLVGLSLGGVTRGGAQRWYTLGSFNMQPSELVKIAIVVYLAHSFSIAGREIENFWSGLAPRLAVALLVAGLIGVQPNFSTAAVLCMVTIAMAYVAGARMQHLGALAVMGAIGGAVLIAIAPYRLARIYAVIDPWSDPLGKGFQLIQSFIAFASGGWFGQGLGHSKQRMSFLPEAHTDFILSVVGEEFGVLGVILLVALFLLLAWRGFRIAVLHPDPFGRLLAYGLTLTIVLQAAINVGVALGMMPTTGLVLPFISYGGSGLIGAMIEIGMLTSLSRVTG